MDAQPRDHARRRRSRGGWRPELRRAIHEAVTDARRHHRVHVSASTHLGDERNDLCSRAGHSPSLCWWVRRRGRGFTGRARTVCSSTPLTGGNASRNSSPRRLHPLSVHEARARGCRNLPSVPPSRTRRRSPSWECPEPRPARPPLYCCCLSKRERQALLRPRRRPATQSEQAARYRVGRARS